MNERIRRYDYESEIDEEQDVMRYSTPRQKRGAPSECRAIHAFSFVSLSRAH